jgi:hypothetical protein
MAGRGWDPDARTTTVQLNPAASSLASLATVIESEQEPNSSCRNQITGIGHITLTRRVDDEAFVNARYPITDGQSHWEAWWLPKGAAFPLLPGPVTNPFANLQIYFQFPGSGFAPCRTCTVDFLAYTGTTFIGPLHQNISQYLQVSPKPPPGWPPSTTTPTTVRWVRRSSGKLRPPGRSRSRTACRTGTP